MSWHCQHLMFGSLLEPSLDPRVWILDCIKKDTSVVRPDSLNPKRLNETAGHLWLTKQNVYHHVVWGASWGAHYVRYAISRENTFRTYNLESKSSMRLPGISKRAHATT